MKKQSRNKKIVFTTGSDGMLGSNILRILVKQGYTVRAMVQPGRSPKTINHLPGVEIVYGDLTNYEQVHQLMAGCDYVIHIAAFAASWPTRSQKYFDVNVKGTRHMIDAALDHNIDRFIHISSSNTQGFTNSKRFPGNERLPWSGDQGMDYLLTKRVSHMMVEQAVQTQHLPAVLICPTYMIGEFDSGPSSGELLIRAWNSPFKFCTSGGKNFVAANDVAVAAVNALSMGQIGEAYICGNANLKFRELFQCIEDVTGKSQSRLVIPPYLVLAIGWLMDFLAKILRKKPMLTLVMARSSTMEMYYSQRKAIRELKMPQTHIRTAIRNAYRWFGEHKYLNDYETEYA